jgi:hypothetical protein
MIDIVRATKKEECAYFIEKDTRCALVYLKNGKPSKCTFREFQTCKKYLEYQRKYICANLIYLIFMTKGGGLYPT